MVKNVRLLEVASLFMESFGAIATVYSHVASYGSFFLFFFAFFDQTTCKDPNILVGVWPLKSSCVPFVCHYSSRSVVEC